MEVFQRRSSEGNKTYNVISEGVFCVFICFRTTVIEIQAVEDKDLVVVIVYYNRMIENDELDVGTAVEP